MARESSARQLLCVGLLLASLTACSSHSSQTQQSINSSGPAPAEALGPANDPTGQRPPTATEIGSGGCLLRDKSQATSSATIRYPLEPFSGPNPPDDLAKREIYRVFKEGDPRWYEYASLQPGAIAWISEFACSTGTWFHEPEYAGRPDIVGASIVSAVQFCGLLKSGTFQSQGGEADAPLGGGLTAREIASHLCPEALG